jgi:hypothetical protein
MIDIPSVKWVAVIVAAIAAVVIGGLWYAPFLFGKVWQRSIGKTDAELVAMRKKAGPGYALAIVGALVTAWVVAVTVKWAGATTAMDAVEVGVIVWLGYIVSQMVIGTMFEGRSWTLFGINMSNQLVNILVMALVTTLWT